MNWEEYDPDTEELVELTRSITDDLQNAESCETKKDFVENLKSAKANALVLADKINEILAEVT